jgi:hypothetical protein
VGLSGDNGGSKSSWELVLQGLEDKDGVGGGGQTGAKKEIEQVRQSPR